ncbi:hypothetical protein [Runella zeae]|uniref:hypothetical protein n=1 Tax=Runella zeae TaxID=94255 RepID=UPI002356640C|nr:hypothetical protein [Runella zeae]
MQYKLEYIVPEHIEKSDVEKVFHLCEQSRAFDSLLKKGNIMNVQEGGRVFGGKRMRGEFYILHPEQVQHMIDMLCAFGVPYEVVNNIVEEFSKK